MHTKMNMKWNLKSFKINLQELKPLKIIINLLENNKKISISSNN